MKKSGSRTIAVKTLARVEGEGGVTIHTCKGEVTGVELQIYEPPRFYEALLRGRAAVEAPDITARICGICPIAYQMSAVHAVERIFGVELPPPLVALRRLLYCGEWIESHALHVFLLHTPDFLGFDSALAMAEASPAHAETVRAGLRIKKAGNSILRVVGGREVHPVNVRVGGFYRVPRADELAPLRAELTWGRDAAIDLIRWTSALSFPSFELDYELVALRDGVHYPMNAGRVVSNRGLDIAPQDFATHFEEYQVPHSHALQSRRLATGAEAAAATYLVGPIARWALNHDVAPALVRDAAAATGLGPQLIRNPFMSIVVRALEILLAIDEALRLIAAYEPPPRPTVDYEPRAGIGAAITEAPRGILYHRYETDADGMIRTATIIPPTSQNQAQIESDLLRLAPALLKLPNKEAGLQAERLIRNYDPCISCATHFLTLSVEEQ